MQRIMRKKPQILATEPLAQTRLFHVEAVDLAFSNGEKRRYERLRRAHAGAVMMVPITANQEFVLIREYAVGIEDYELTFPKGFIDQGETVNQAADRELKEEIGFGAKSITFLRKVHASAAYMQSRLNIVLAQDLYSESLPGDEPEALEIVYWPLSDYNALLTQADFISSACVAALLLTKEVLQLD